jgi:enoyl-CoA hydratase
MSEAPVLRVERRDATVLLTIDRPQALNALNAAVLDALDAAIDDIARDSTVRAVVLTGAGRAFVAGADIAAMRDLTALRAESFAARGQAVLDRLAALPVPVIAAVGGFALGGGCELAMACDLILAGQRASFGQPEVKLGLIPGFGGTQRLARRVGLARALDLCLTGRVIGADEAVAIGLASRKVDSDVAADVVDAALQVAATIGGMGPVAVQLCKRVIHEHVDGPLAAGLAAERAAFGLCFATEDQREGTAAFLEKRPAAFKGR